MFGGSTLKGREGRLGELLSSAVADASQAYRGVTPALVLSSRLGEGGMPYSSDEIYGLSGGRPLEVLDVGERGRYYPLGGRIKASSPENLAHEAVHLAQHRASPFTFSLRALAEFLRYGDPGVYDAPGTLESEAAGRADSLLSAIQGERLRLMLGGIPAWRLGVTSGR